MNATSVTGVTLVQAATMLAAHLADHTLPDPAYLRVNTHHGHFEVAAQLQATTVPTVARDLLAWATTLPPVNGEVWRHRRPRTPVHRQQLTGPAGAIELDVFGAVDYDPARFADLVAGDRRTVFLGQLRSWATLDVPGDPR